MKHIFLVTTLFATSLDAFRLSSRAPEFEAIAIPVGIVLFCAAVDGIIGRTRRGALIGSACAILVSLSYRQAAVVAIAAAIALIGSAIWFRKHKPLVFGFIPLILWIGSAALLAASSLFAENEIAMSPDYWGSGASYLYVLLGATAWLTLPIGIAVAAVCYAVYLFLRRKKP